MSRVARAAFLLLTSSCLADAAQARPQLLVADNLRDALIRVDLDTGAQTVVRELEILSSTRLAKGPGGGIYLVQPQLGWIERLGADGQPAGPRIEGDPLRAPWNAATLPGGALVVTNSDHPETLIEIGPGDARTTLATAPIGSPIAVATAPDGTLLVLEWTTRRLHAVDPETREATMLSDEGLFQCPRDVAVGSGGSIFVADLCDCSSPAHPALCPDPESGEAFPLRVLRIDPTSGAQTLLYTSEDAPDECRIAASAELGPFVACHYEEGSEEAPIATDRAWSLDPLSGLATPLGSVSGEVAALPPYGLWYDSLPVGLAGVAILADGRLAVADDTLGAIWAFDALGAPTPLASGGPFSLETGVFIAQDPIWGGTWPWVVHCPFQGLLVRADNELVVVDRSYEPLGDDDGRCTTGLLTASLSGGDPTATPVAPLPSVLELEPIDGAATHALAVVRRNRYAGEAPEPIDDTGVVSVDLVSGAQEPLLPHPSDLQRARTLAQPRALVARGSTLWIGDEMLGKATVVRFDASTGELTRFDLENGDVVEDLALAPDGGVFIQRPYVIDHLDPTTGTQEPVASTGFGYTPGSSSHPHPCGTAIATTAAGELFFATRAIADMQPCAAAIKRVEADGSSSIVTTGGELISPVDILVLPEPSPAPAGAGALLAIALSAGLRARPRGRRRD